jgi:hypothetical protein
LARIGYAQDIPYSYSFVIDIFFNSAPSEWFGEQFFVQNDLQNQTTIILCDKRQKRLVPNNE